jgi:hypothetical protein
VDVSREGSTVDIRFDRYRQDFSYCNGVTHGSDSHTGTVAGNVITLPGKRTLRLSGGGLTVVEPGSRGPHHFRRLRGSAERTRLVHAFFAREAALRRSVKYPPQVADIYAHCKK